VSEADAVQGARSAEHDTYQIDRRVGEHRATQQCAAAGTCSGLP